MPCDLTAAALVEARRKMTIKAALFEHVLAPFFQTCLIAEGVFSYLAFPRDSCK